MYLNQRCPRIICFCETSAHNENTHSITAPFHQLTPHWEISHCTSLQQQLHCSSQTCTASRVLLCQELGYMLPLRVTTALHCTSLHLRCTVLVSQAGGLLLKCWFVESLADETAPVTQGLGSSTQGAGIISRQDLRSFAGG